MFTVVSKDELRADFSKNASQYYQVDLFAREGFQRKACAQCGKGFWTAAGTESCGDSAHTKYSFFKEKPLNETYAGFWKKTAEFWKKRGHEVIPRYPVLSRWRDDLYFTIASIVDFQRLERGKIVFEYPANPLFVPQMCLRFGDIANVGVTGRHMSCFMMAGQHAFNPPKEGYWKDECLRYNYEYLTGVLGVDKKDVTYVEDVWNMPDFSAYGPCIEAYSKGSELVNSVFMQYRWDDAANRQEELATKVIDVGWGFERLLWYHRGDLTAYDAVFPREIAFMKQRAQLDLNEEQFRRYAALAATLDVENLRSFQEEKRKIAGDLGLSAGQLERGIAPMQGIYAIADHTRTLLFALSDGALPSNTAGGYNLRVLLRRSLSFINEYNFDFNLLDLMRMHAEDLKALFPELLENVHHAEPILAVEKRKYDASLQKARGLAKTILARGKPLTAEELFTHYESNGLTPELLEKVAKEEGKSIEVPGAFYRKLTEKHVLHKTRENVPADIAALPPTRALYYETPLTFTGTAKVLYSKGRDVVLDQTLFYPEGGGQMFDTGAINGKAVVNVQKTYGAIVHTLKEPAAFPVGSTVEMAVDEERRRAIMRHHTATHVMINTLHQVLGHHVWQSGSRKDAGVAHVDFTHFEKPSREQLDDVERVVNQRVADARPVHAKTWDRIEAERKYGFRIYQGGGAIGREIRLVHIGAPGGGERGADAGTESRGGGDATGIGRAVGREPSATGTELDVESCGGTHVANTSELGLVKIVACEQVQDGVVRVYYKSGEKALEHVQEQQRLLDDAAAALGTAPKDLVKTAQKIVGEWKERGKQIEKLEDLVAKSTARTLVADARAKNATGVEAELALDARALEKTAALVAAEAGFTACLSNADGFVACAASPASGKKALELLKAAGAKGGGNDAFARGKKSVTGERI